MDLERVTALFQENFDTFGELGASLSVWSEGREVLSIAAGWQDRERTIPWTVETLVLVWSATKGPAAACLLHACAARGLPLSTLVAEVWPDFAQGGKERITIAQVMSHQAGLPALSHEVSVLDHPAVATALAAAIPQWEPGSAHGYHPRTFGFLVDELVRRIAAVPLGEYWRTHFAEPLGLEFFVGMPAGLASEAAPVFPAKSAPPKGDPFYTAFMTSGSLTSRAFASPRGLHSVASLNTPDARSRSFPAFGGVGTARALAKFYAMLAQDGALSGQTVLAPPTIDAMSTTLADGADRVLLMPTAFSAGFMKDPLDADGRKLRSTFGPSLCAFGHPGAGGSLAFADPEHRIAFAYVMNQMEPGVLPNAKSLRLVEALYAGF
jgi:CubicO group peptidase (beta-lactamase class C family)